MGNSCQRMMKQDMDDEDIYAALGRSELISSDYMKKRSNPFSNLKKRILRAPSFSFSGRSADSSLSVKELDDVPRLLNSELSIRDEHQHQHAITAINSPNSPCKLENPDLNQDVEDVNKEADDFIAKMKERLKSERKVSEMEYIDRIQRGSL